MYDTGMLELIWIEFFSQSKYSPGIFLGGPPLNTWLRITGVPDQIRIGHLQNYESRFHRHALNASPQDNSSNTCELRLQGALHLHTKPDFSSGFISSSLTYSWNSWNFFVALIWCAVFLLSGTRTRRFLRRHEWRIEQRNSRASCMAGS